MNDQELASHWDADHRFAAITTLASGLLVIVGTALFFTLGMGPAEMKEIASIIRFVLSHIEPEQTQIDGKKEPSRAKYVFTGTAKQDARKRVDELLSGFRLYPPLDEGLLREIVGL